MSDPWIEITPAQGMTETKTQAPIPPKKNIFSKAMPWREISAEEFAEMPPSASTPWKEITPTTQDISKTRTADRSGVVTVSNDPNATLPARNILDTKATYWGTRLVGGPLERAAFGLAQLPLQLEKWKRKQVDKLPDGRLKSFVKSTVAGDIPFVSDEMLDAGLDYTDPMKFGFFTPKEMETKEYRDVAAYEKSTGRGHLNRVVEAGADFTGFLVTLVAARKLPAFSGQTQAGQRLSNIANAGKFNLVSKGTKNAVWAGQQVKNAALLGLHGALTTPGTPRERAEVAAMRSVYGLTPVMTGYLGVANLPGVVGKVAPRLTDFLINSALTTAVPNGYADSYKRNGGFTDNFWGEALPQLVMDAAFSITTAGLPSQIKNQNLQARYNHLKKQGKTAQSFEQFKTEHDKLEAILMKEVKLPKGTPTEVKRKGSYIVEEMKTGVDPEGKPLPVKETVVDKSQDPPLATIKTQMKARNTIKNLAFVGATGKKLNLNYDDLPLHVQNRLNDLIAKTADEKMAEETVNQFIKDLSSEIHVEAGKGDDVNTKVWYGKEQRWLPVSELVRVIDRDSANVQDAYDKLDSLTFYHRREGTAAKLPDIRGAIERARAQKELRFINQPRVEREEPGTGTLVYTTPPRPTPPVRPVLSAPQPVLRLPAPVDPLPRPARTPQGEIINYPDREQGQSLAVKEQVEKEQRKVEVRQPIVGVVPRNAEPQTQWVRDSFNHYREMAKSAINVPVQWLKGKGEYLYSKVDKGQFIKKALKGGGVSPARDKIYLHEGVMNGLWNRYQKQIANDPILNHEVLIPPGLSKEDFFKWAEEHERVHLQTGLDGGSVDENMVNAIALEKIGRGDLAKLIEHRLAKGSETREFQEKRKFADLEIAKQHEEAQVSQPNKDTAPIAKEKTEVVVRAEEVDKDGYLETKEETFDIEDEASLDTMDVIEKFFTKHGFELNPSDPEGSVARLPKHLLQELQTRLLSNEVKIVEGGETKLDDLDETFHVSSLKDDARATAKVTKFIEDWQADREYTVKIYRNNPELAKSNLEKVDAFHQRLWEDFLKTVHDETNPNLNKKARATWEKKFNQQLKVFKRRQGIELEDALHGVKKQKSPFTGQAIPKRAVPHVGQNGTAAQNLSVGLRLAMAGMRFFGFDNQRFQRFVGAKNFQKWTEKTYNVLGTTKDAVVGTLVSDKRKRAYDNFLGARVTDVIVQSVYEDVKKAHPLASKADLQDKTRLYLDIMQRAAQEINHNEDDPLTTYTVTKVGEGFPYKPFDPKKDKVNQKKVTVDSLVRIHTALGKVPDTATVAQWVQARPRLAYFNLLTPQLKSLLIWTKAEVERPVLKELLKSGVLDSADMFKNIQMGYARRLWFKPEHQKGSQYRKSVDSTRVQEAEYDTFDEFEAAASSGKYGTGLRSVADYSLSLGDYVRDGFDRLGQQHVINIFKALPNPNNPALKIVEYTKDHVGDGDGIRPENFLTNQGYRIMANAPGLSEFGLDGRFGVPWVHESVVDIINSIYNPSSPGQGLKAWNQINGIVKRFVMFSPNLFYQPLPGMGIKKTIKYGIAPLATGELFRQTKGFAPSKQFAEGKKIASGEYSPFEHLQMGYDDEKLDLFLRHGLRGFDFEYSLKMMFDKAGENQEHPLLKSKLDRASELLLSKGGIDRYTFNYYIARNVYELANVHYERFLHQGKDKEAAARLASQVTNDITGMVDSVIYGKEGPMLQAVLFARDFTMSFLRVLTGALGLKQDFQTEGYRKYLNSLFHGEKTRQDFDALQGQYLKHLAKAIIWKVALVNAIQYAWSMYNDDEDERGKFAFQNEPSKRLAIRTPFKDEEGRWIFMDILTLREANQLNDILASIPGFKDVDGGMGIPSLFRAKASYAFNQLVDQLSKVDYMGKPITKEGATFTESLGDRGRHALASATPTPIRSDVKKPKYQLLSSTMGVPLKRAEFSSADNISWETQKKWKDIVNRAEYQKFRLQRDKYTADEGQMIEMMERGEISPETLTQWFQKKAFPATTFFMQNRREIEEAPWKEIK